MNIFSSSVYRVFGEQFPPLLYRGKSWSLLLEAIFLLSEANSPAHYWASFLHFSWKFSRLFFASFPSNNWHSIVQMRVYNCIHKFIILPAVLWIRILKDPNLFCRIRIHICCRCDLVHVRIRVRKNGTCQFKLFVLFNDEQKRLKNLSAFLKIHYLHFTTEDILQYKYILININNCVTF